jgi:hypothetical protein
MTNTKHEKLKKDGQHVGFVEYVSVTVDAKL